MKFVVIQSHFNTIKARFERHEVTAKDEERAWEKIEETISCNMSQEWLLSPRAFAELRRLIVGNDLKDIEDLLVGGNCDEALKRLRKLYK